MKRTALVCWIVAVPLIVGHGQVRPLESQVQKPVRQCLHGENETGAEEVRRTEALATMRMIEDILRSFPGLLAQSPSWEMVAQASAVTRLQRTAGPVGELARKVRWGMSEPLPGWGIAYVTGRAESKYALTDLRDPCAFTYSSADPDVITGRGRLVPLT